MNPAFYNENDPKAAAWLRELIKAGLIAPGIVDERSISNISPKDLDGFTQCHFFAGIGGWSYALRLAGIPDSVPVWTGSCPCQPFSAAGKGAGTKDERHLWPSFARLIEARRPSTVFGEQVASKDGRLWLAGVFADLEGMGYRRAAADLCAAGIGAPHIRQRLYWVADSAKQRREWSIKAAPDSGRGGIEHNSATRGLGNPNGSRLKARDALAIAGESRPELPDESGALGELALADGRQSSDGDLQRCGEYGLKPEDGGAGRMGDTAGEQARLSRFPWGQSDSIPCSDGKARRVESGTFPLAHGVSGRVGLLRGYGNAIVPQVAAEFIQAFLELSEV